MSLETRSPSRRSSSLADPTNYPPRRQFDAKALTRNDLVRRLEQANAEPTSPASPPDPITTDSVRGLSPMQALDAVNGSMLDPLRHRGGQ